MLAWIGLAVLLGAAGLAILAVLTLRLWRQVRELARDVRAAGDRIATATAELQRPAPPR
jgi:HAMP domain-containing protein